MGMSIVRMLRAATELAFPLLCGGCGRRGAAWCDRCAFVSGMPGMQARPVPLGTAAPLTWAAGAFTGPLARGLVAYKDQDRRDLAEVFGAGLRESVTCAARAAVGPSGSGLTRQVLVVPVPSTRRAKNRRGDVPLIGLLRVALRDGWDLLSTSPASEHDAPVVVTLSALLASRGAVLDQRVLSRTQRLRNVHGSMHVKSSRQIGRGAWPPVVLADDVCTTGATLAEGARAVRAAGASVVVAAVVAATPSTEHPAA